MRLSRLSGIYVYIFARLSRLSRGAPKYIDVTRPYIDVRAPNIDARACTYIDARVYNYIDVRAHIYIDARPRVDIIYRVTSSTL